MCAHFPVSDAHAYNPRVMQYQILIEHPNQNGYVASVIGLPNCVAEGATEDEALNRVKLRLKARLAQSKIVTVEVDVPVRGMTGNPWIDSAGVYKDDPTYDEFLEEIAKYRRELDVEMEARESLAHQGVAG